jgi:hypothetical protein
MITFTGNPDDGSGSPGGYGPRLWIKFENDHVACLRTIETFKTICLWGGHDRELLSQDPTSSDRILSWEFPTPRKQARDREDYSWRWKAAIEYLQMIGAGRITDRDAQVHFMDGFK